jgi:hypothetical protein
MAGLDPAIRRDAKIGANRASSRQPRVIVGSNPRIKSGCGDDDEGGSNAIPVGAGETADDSE